MAHDPEAQTNDKVNTTKGSDSKLKSTNTEVTSNNEYLLDMVFVLDCTGSMASYINSARDNIVNISKELSKMSKAKTNENNNKENDKTDRNNDKNVNESKSQTNNDANESKNDPIETQVEGQVDAAPSSSTAAAAPADVAVATAVADTAAAPSATDVVDSKNTDIIDESKVSNPEPKKKLSCKFAVVAYRDHPPQDNTFITQIRDFTASSVMIEQYLSTLKASGGGDGPESLTTALYDTLYNLKYRENSQRIIIVITDAPPHGIEGSGSGDGFPKGDPWPKYKLAKPKNNNKGKKKPMFGIKTRSSESGLTDKYEKDNTAQMTDILEIIRDITDNLQASFYTVACEPCISTSYDYARDLMEAMAEMSNGKYLPLAKANLLPKVIIGSVKQQMIIDELTESIDKEIESLRKEYKKNNKLNELTEDVIAEFMEKKWENANITYKEVAIGTLYRKERKRDNIEILLNRQECKSLKDFAKKRVKLARLTNSDFRHLDKKSKRKYRKGGKSGAKSKAEKFAGLFEEDDKRSFVGSEPYDTDTDTDDSGDESESESEDESDSSSDSDSNNSKSGMGIIEEEENDEKSATIEEEKKMEKKMEKKKKKKKKGKKGKKEAKKKRADSPRYPRRGSFDSLDGRDSLSDGSSGHGGYAMKTRFFTETNDNWSDSCDSQNVYEEVRKMDAKGVRKVVGRYMQTKETFDDSFSE